MKHLIVILFLTFLLIQINLANILDVPTVQYPTIQAGIDSAFTGDTVLVQPGSYVENINLLGKNIVLTSLYLTSGDTTHISQTVIDGGFSNSVVIYENGEDSSSVLSGFTITNGFAFPDNGGGIKCTNNSNPTLENLRITDNGARNGGGIFCSISSSPTLTNVLVLDNASLFLGGGVFCQSKSSPTLHNVSIISNVANQDGGGLFLSDSCLVDFSNVNIKQNRSVGSGGGIFCEVNSDFTADSVRIEYNYANDFGGGIFCSESSPTLINTTVLLDTAYQGGGFFLETSPDLTLENVIISNNRSYSEGGGIGLFESNVNFKKTKIFNNQAFGSGGGIYLSFSTLTFEESDPSAIYLNYAGYAGNDLFSEDEEIIEVAVDTFTVMSPSDYQAYPLSAFSFTITSGLIEQVDQDLFVNPNGDNANSGLSEAEPLKNIFYALTKVIADTLNPHTIWLKKGIYSSDTNGETFPLNMKAFVSLEGHSDSVSVCDAQNKSSLFIFNNDQGITLNRIALTGGTADFGGGIYCEKSNPLLSKVTMTNNVAFNGGGIYCWESNPIVVNSIFWENTPEAVYFESYGDTSSIVVSYSDIQGGQNNIETSANGTIYWQEGNIDTDPLFADTSTLDFSLLGDSPCIDTGTSLFVWQGDTLIKLNKEDGDFNGSFPDIGAYESPELPNIIADNTIIPRHYSLFQNYPNPFNPATKIRLALPMAEKVKIEIFNTLGQKVETIFDGKLPPGSHEIEFNGSTYASGMYFYTMTAGSYNYVRKMLLVK